MNTKENGSESDARFRGQQHMRSISNLGKWKALTYCGCVQWSEIDAWGKKYALLRVPLKLATWC